MNERCATEICIRRYRSGDTGALELLVQRYKKPLYGFIYKMTNTRIEADEIFQEVWLRAIRNLPTYRDRRFLSWLFRIAHNLIVDRYRKLSREVALGVSEEEGDTGWTDRVPDPRPGPAGAVSARDLGVHIEQAVSRLPKEQREVFLLRTSRDLSFKEIARIQRVSINTALARMQYALDKLRKDLRETAMTGEVTP